MPLPSTRFRALRSYEADPNYANSQYGELLVSERTPVLSLSPAVPISTLRNTVDALSGAEIEREDSEYRLRTAANGGSSLTLDSAQRGQYVPGYTAQAGLGVRIPSAPTGNQRIEWGYMDDDDGIFFGLDATGPFVARRKNGTDQIWRQSQWSADKLDGTGASGHTLDLTTGNILHIDFSWYGYGTIEWKIVFADEYGRQQVITMHRFTPQNELSIAMPNLPIRTKVANNGTATALAFYVAGRQFSVEGRFRPTERVSAHHVMNVSVGTSLTPLMTFRRKSALAVIGIGVEGFDIITTGNIMVALHSKATLGGTPAFSALADVPPSETALEVDTSATSVTGGVMLHTSLAVAGGGTGNGASLRRAGEPLLLPAGDLSFSARAISGTSSVTLVVRMLEGW